MNPYDGPLEKLYGSVYIDTFSKDDSTNTYHVLVPGAQDNPRRGD